MKNYLSVCIYTCTHAAKDPKHLYWYVSLPFSGGQYQSAVKKLSLKVSAYTVCVVLGGIFAPNFTETHTIANSETNLLDHVLIEMAHNHPAMDDHPYRIYRSPTENVSVTVKWPCAMDQNSASHVLAGGAGMTWQRCWCLRCSNPIWYPPSFTRKV